MPGLAEILAQYAEGVRRQEFGPDYDIRRRRGEQELELGQARLDQAPLQTRALEQGLERGGLGIDALRRDAEDFAERKRTLQELGLEGFDVAGPAMRYAEGAPDREIARGAARTGADIATRQLETMPTAEEAQADRGAIRAERAGRAAYYSQGGRSTAGPRYAGRPVDEEVLNSARQEAMRMYAGGEGLPEGVYLDDDGAFKQRGTGGFFGSDDPYQLSLEDLNMIHQLTVQRLQAAGLSPEAIEKAGLQLPGEGGGDDPMGLR